MGMHERKSASTWSAIFSTLRLDGFFGRATRKLPAANTPLAPIAPMAKLDVDPDVPA
jgi:hypothetical protein